MEVAGADLTQISVRLLNYGFPEQAVLFELDRDATTADTRF